VRVAIFIRQGGLWVRRGFYAGYMADAKDAAVRLLEEQEDRGIMDAHGADVLLVEFDSEPNQVQMFRAVRSGLRLDVV
jgi:hypothetical protein